MQDVPHVTSHGSADASVKQKSKYLLLLRSAVLVEITKLLEVDVGEAARRDTGDTRASPIFRSVGGIVRSTGLVSRRSVV